MRRRFSRKVALVGVSVLSLVVNSALLSHYGVAPASAAPSAVGVGLIADPGIVTFNAAAAGEAVVQTITITNVAGAPNQPDTWQLRTPNTAATPVFQFLQSGTTCGDVGPGPTYLQPTTLTTGASCTIRVLFTAPASTGLFLAEIAPCPPEVVERQIPFVTVNGAATNSNGYPCGVEFVDSPNNQQNQLQVANLAVDPAVSPQAEAAEVSQTGISLVARVGNDPATLTANKSKMDFGKVKKGKSSKLTVKLTNQGTAPASVDDIEVSGRYFSLSSENCPNTLAAGDSCKVVVKFKPKAKGSFTGVLEIDGLKVTLKGKGKGK